MNEWPNDVGCPMQLSQWHHEMNSEERWICAPFESSFESGVAAWPRGLLMLLGPLPRDGGSHFSKWVGNSRSISWGMVDPLAESMHPSINLTCGILGSYCCHFGSINAHRCALLDLTLQVCNLLVATNKCIGENVSTFTCNLGICHIMPQVPAHCWALERFSRPTLKGIGPPSNTMQRTCIFHHVPPHLGKSCWVLQIMNYFLPGV